MLFRRTSFLGLRTVILLMLSVVFMVVDHQYDHLVKLRSALSFISLPITSIVDYPTHIAQMLTTDVKSRQALLKRNDELEAKVLILSAKLQHFLALQQENNELRALLHSNTYSNSKKVLVARLLAVDLSVDNQQMIINKGKRNGVYVGQPVVDATGLLGQVTTVGPVTSHVLLVTNRRSAVPVRDTATGVRSIAEGLGYTGKLVLLHVDETDKINVGDVFVTSGLGGRYPPGLPVGVVSKVVRTHTDAFAKVIVLPKASMKRSHHVLLVWHHE